MPVTACAQILAVVGVLQKRDIEGVGVSWLEKHWVRGTSVEDLGAGNQEERGKGMN